MDISYINDLHIDNWVMNNKSYEKHKKSVKEFIKRLIENSYIYDKDVIIIAGDISHYNHVTYWVLEEFSEQFKKVFFVNGNHDYYMITRNQRSKYRNNSVSKALELNNLLSQLSNVTFFNSFTGNVTERYNGVRFAGCTMTSVPKGEEEISFYNGFMNDKKYISHEPKLYNEKDINTYNTVISDFRPNIFISHYPLVRTYSHNKHLNDGSIGSYLCKVGKHIAPINIFGHVHESDVCYEVGNSKHYTNALGYPLEHLNSKIKTFTYKTR
ncbi:metallophosphoesterase family protein [Staphylococcus chromogenes]|uniref:metallophosphoesterase family protein n=1 Tax=Staphylococcus chromogenes TaxID=46126 RepID=UPI0028876184|nr:metallophosphoesterase [Staphylococcus chromogenes]MDT0700351.1 metallophosphoesterase [Staphylococcus chromogenes]